MYLNVNYDSEETRVLYTRYEHGNLPVRIDEREGKTVYTLDRPGAPVVYKSAKSLLSDLYGHEVNISLSRYFKLNTSRSASLFHVLAPAPAEPRQTELVIDGCTQTQPQSTPIKVDESENLERKFQTDPPAEKNLDRKGVLGSKKLPEVEETFDLEEFESGLERELDRLEGLVGIDLGAESERGGAKFKADEVRKLLWRGFAGKMLSQGYDPEDVLQEVYRGLLVRNKGKCPWDRRKSTFGHYVHMVTSCVLTNYHRKQVKRVDKDALSLSGVVDEAHTWDVGSCDIDAGDEYGDKLVYEGLSQYINKLPDNGPEALLGRKLLPMVAAGMQRGEIVAQTGHKPSLVSRALAWLRQATALWAKSSGMKSAVPSKYL